MTLLAKRTTKNIPAVSTTTSTGKKKQAILNKFLSKTYHMIDQCDPSIASWSSAGDSFTVKDIQAFEQSVLPNYFNHSHFTSFTRQLNFYGFQKLRSDWDLQMKGNNSVRFCHEFFKKDQPELLYKIQRATAGGNSSKQPSSPGSRPSSPVACPRSEAPFHLGPKTPAGGSFARPGADV